MPYPEDYILEMGNTELVSMPSTKFLGIVPNDTINFKCHISELCQKLNFALLLLHCARPILDEKTIVNLYYPFFQPHLIYGIEFYGHTANCHLKLIYLLQTSALRIILESPPRDRFTTNFKELKLCPLKCFTNTDFSYIQHWECP